MQSHLKMEMSTLRSQVISSFDSDFQQTRQHVKHAKQKIPASRKRDRGKTLLANWHFAHFWMRQDSQFYFHLVWYFCDILTGRCHSILHKFYYENFIIWCAKKRTVLRNYNLWMHRFNLHSITDNWFWSGSRETLLASLTTNQSIHNDFSFSHQSHFWCHLALVWIKFSHYQSHFTQSIGFSFRVMAQRALNIFFSSVRL